MLARLLVIFTGLAGVANGAEASTGLSADTLLNYGGGGGRAEASRYMDATDSNFGMPSSSGYASMPSAPSAQGYAPYMQVCVLCVHVFCVRVRVFCVCL